MASKLRLTPLIKDKEVLGQEQVSNEALPIMQDKTKPRLRLTPPDMPNVKSAPIGGTIEGFDEVDFSELDRDIAPDQNIEAQLAQTQSGWELFGKATARSAAEIGFGTLEGLSYLLDWEQAADYAAGDEQEFSNWFADLMKQGKEAVREATPIYQTESAQEGFDPFDSTWWASNADSIVSTVSMMVPAWGAVKGLSLAGKGVRALMGASKAAKAAKTVKKGSELIKDINKVLGSNKLQNVLSGVSQATVSRYMENTMEAAETYQSTLQELVGQGMSEEDAKAKAGEAARTSWTANWVNLAFDIAQYMTLTKGPSIANFANKELRKGLLAKAGDYLGGMTQEAAEEGIQFVVAEEAKRSAIGNKPFLELKGFGARMSDYLSDPEMQSAMFLGAFGGGLFQAVGSGANKIQGLIRNEEAYLATVLSLDKGDIATAHQVQDTKLLQQAYAYARAGKLGNLKSFYQEMSEASDADLLAKGMSMEEIADKRERDAEILADIDFIGNEYARIYDNADLSEQQKADELSHLHQKNTNNRTLEKINKRFEEAKTKALKEGLTAEQFDLKVNKFRLSILEDTLKQEEKNAEELGNEGLVKALKQRIEKAKEAIKTSEEALKAQSLPTDQVPTSTADGSLFGDGYNTGKFGSNGLVFQQEQLGVNNDYIDSLLQTIGEPDYLEKREKQVQNENLEQALALVNHKTPLSVLDKILKSDSLNEENKKKVQEKVDQLTEANNNIATIPTNEATKEEDIKKRYASSLTLRSDLSKISERGGDIAGIVNGETFANKYANNAEFKKIVDELYSDLQKERSTDVDTNTPTPVDTPTPTSGNPVTGGNSESVVDYGVNESNIARSNQHVLYTYEGDGKFSVTGLKDSEGNIISSKKLVTKEFLEAELSAIYGRDVKLSALRGTEEYESPGPYILRESDNTPVAHTFNTIKAKSDGVTQPFMTEADFDVLNDPDVKISGNPVKLRYLLDYEFGPDQQNAQNALIALVVEHEGKEYTVGSLPRVEGSPDTEMNRKVAAMRENLFKEWQASGQTSGIFEGSEAVTVKGRTNGEYNRAAEFSFNPIDILGPNEPLFYGTVKGKDKNGDVIIDTNNGEQVFKDAQGIDIKTTFRGQSLLSNYPGQTVLFIRGASGLYLPAYMQAMPLSTNEKLTKEVMDLLDEFAADVKTAKNDQEISRIQDNINAELSKYIAFAVQYNKETGAFQEVFKASQTSSNEVSEAMGIEALKTLAQNKKMRVDSKKINTSLEYNRQMAEEGRFKIDILPGFKTIGARVKLDLSTVKVTPKVQPTTETTTAAAPTITPTTPVENVLTDSQKKNLEAAKENKKADPAEKKFNTLEDALAHAESLRGKSFNVNGQKVEFVEYRDNILTGAGQRIFVKVKINGVPVTFYSSTGQGKKALQEGVFYPVLGIESDARFNGTWINKIGGVEMASYNNSAALASVGAFIDSNFGNLNDFANEITGNTVALQNPTGEPLSREKGLELRKEYNFEYLNSGRETYSNNEGSKVRQAFKDLVSEVNNSLQEVPTPTTTPTTEAQSIEERKADIERRRKETKNSIKEGFNGVKTWEYIGQFNDQITKETKYEVSQDYYTKEQLINEIDAKYNAELAALESQPTTETTTTAPKKKPVPKISIKRGRKGRNRLADPTQEYEVWNEKEELGWFKKNYPGVPVEVLDDIREVIGKGGPEAWGLFHNASVFIQSNAAKGTAYHEAFHVVFNLMLTEKERNEILKAGETFAKGTINIEEYWADKFMQYQLAEGKVTETFPAKVADFFKRLWQMIRIAGERMGIGSASMNDYMYRVSKGLYAKKAIQKIGNVDFKRNITRFRVAENSYEGVLNPSERPVAKRLLNGIVIEDVLPWYRDELLSEKDGKDYSKLDDKETLAEIFKRGRQTGDKRFTIQGIYETLYEMVEESMSDEDLNDLERDQLQRTLDTLATKTTDPNTGEAVINFTPFLAKVVQGLSNYGVNYNIYSNTASNSTFTEGDVELMMQDEDVVENWMVKEKFIGSFEKFNQKANRLFASVYGSSTFGGYTTFEDPNNVKANLIHNISGSNSIKEMMKKLEELVSFKPDYDKIYKTLQEDTDLRKEFFINIGQRENIGFMMMQRNNDGTAGPFMSNRKNLKGDIIDNLRYSLMNSVHYNPTEKTYSVPNIDKHVETFSSIREKYKNEPNESNLSQEDVDKIKEIVKDLELAISDSELDMLFTETTEGVKNGLERFRLFSGMKNGKGFSTLLDSLQKGQDPFYNEDIESFKSVQSIAESLVKIKDNMYQPSFTSSKGEKIYSVLQSRFMFKHLNMLTKLGEEGDTYIDGYLADPFFKNSPFLNKLRKDSAFRSLHNFVVFDGLRKQGQKKAKEYSELTPQELEAVNINAFFNTPREGMKESATGYYMMPVLSDSTSAAFLKSEKLSEREALNNIIETAKQEYERVKFVKKMKANGTIDTLTDSMIANGDKFQLFPFLNGKDLSKTGALESLVREEVKKLAQSEYDKLIKEGVLIQSKDSAGNIYLADPNGIISNEFIAEKEGYNNVMRYLMNNMYMNMQTLITFGGDTAYYKGKGAVDFTDVYKRIKEIWSPGDYIGVDPNAEWKDKNGNPIPVNETYNVSYIKDPTEVEKIRTEHKDAISEIFPGEANKGIRAAYGAEEDPNSDGLNNTDAATWIDIVRLRDIEIGAGRWNDNKQEVFNAIMNGERLPTNAAIVFNPIKPFQFVHKQIEHADGTITQVPTQHKNAEMLLTPDMAIGNPKLKEILEKMGYEFVGDTWSYDPAKRVTDAVMFTSAVKVGRYNVQDNIKDISTDNTISMRNEDYRIQMPTPEHHLDTDILFGTQLRKILMNIELDKMYKTPEGEMSGKDIFDKYQEAMALNIKESYDELRKIFYNKDGSVNKEKLMLALREEASNRELGEDIEEAFEWLDDNKDETVLPMWHPHIATRVEAMMYSFFKNRITKQRTSKGSGMAVFNTTSYGFSKNNRDGLRKPQIKFNKDRSINHYEALLPAHLKSLERYADENGIIDVNNVPDDVKKGIFYRIPTEDFYSVFHIKVIGYLPASAGGQIVLPDEVTTIAGLDFDIDKLFGMMYNLQKVYNNEERKTQLEVLLKEFPEASEDFPEMMELLKSDEGQTYKNRYESKEPIIDFVDNLVGKKINTVKPEYSFILDQNTANLIKTYIDKVGIDQIKAINESTYKGLKGEDVTAKKKLKAILTMYNSALKPEKYDQALSKVREAIAKGKTKKQLVEELKGELMNYELVKVSSGMGSKEARDNMILDMAYNVLSSRNITENQLRPGNFDKLKMMSKGVQLLRPKTDTSLNPMLPSTRREVFERNMTGNGLIGIFANHNANQMLTVHGNFRFGLSLDINNSKGLDSLSRHEVNDVRITNTLAEFLAAAVDNAKDPVFSFLNITSTTADWAATMTRTGVSIETATAIMSTPPMVKMTKYLNKEGRADDATIDEALDSIRESYLKEIQKRYAEQKRDPQDAITDYEEYRKKGYANTLTLEIANKGENASDYTGSIADLIRTEGKELSKVDDKQLSDAMLVIDYMQKVITNSGALKPTVAAMRFDSVSAAAKPSIAENIDVEKKKQTAINKGKQKLASGERVLTGFEEFMSADSPIPYVNMFYEYGVEKANEIVKDVTGIPYADPNSIFNGVANWIASMSKREGGLDAKDKNRIYRAVMTVISSGYTTYTPQELETITKELPSRLDKYLKQNPDSPYRMLLLRFISKPSENVQGVDIIEFNNSGLTDSHKQDLKDIWKAMLYSSKEEDVQLAKDLAKYSFANSGYVFGPTSFSDLIPTRYISEMHDNPNISYTDYLKQEFKMLAEMTDLTARGNMITGITDQVIRNFYTSLPIPNITLGKDNLSLKRDENNDIHIEMDIKKVPNMIIVENIADPNNTSQQDIEPSKYLKTTITDPVTKISRPVLFQKTGLNDKNGNVIYKEIPRLGLNNEIVETDYSLVNTTTPLLSRIHNYVTKTVPVVQETQKASSSELGNAVGEMIADSSSGLADSVRNYDETSPVDSTHPSVIAVKRMNPEEQTNAKETIDNKPDVTPESKETFNEIVKIAEETVKQEVTEETVTEEQQLPTVPETVIINGVTIDTGTIKLNEQQYSALQSMADFIDSTIQGEINDQTISYTLQGYAGTGKTTITKFLIDYIKEKRKSFEITSPTHRAKEVLMDKTKEQAMTLQKALGLSPGVELEKFTLDNKYFISKTDPKLPFRGIFIVDEASMINDDLYQMIIQEAKAAGAKVIFIGDDAQLKPVKQRKKAKPFSRETNISRLTQVMRTADGNPMPSEVLQPIRNNPSSNVDVFDHVDNLSQKGEGIIFTNSKEEWENMMLSEFDLQELVDNPNKVRVLAFTNNRVAQLNTMIRNQMFGYQPEPFYKGEMMMMYENLFYDPATQDYDYSNGSDVIVDNIVYTENHTIRSPFSGKTFKVAGYVLHMIDAKKGIPKANSLFVADINMVNSEYLQELEDLKDAANKANGRKRGMLWSMHFKLSAAYNLTVPVYKIKGRIFTDQNQAKKYLAENGIKTDDIGRYKIKDKSLDYAYAHTIHKSQGGTYDKAFVDENDIDRMRSFTNPDHELVNQLKYVGFSRSSQLTVSLSSKAAQKASQQKPVEPTQTQEEFPSDITDIDVISDVISDAKLDFEGTLSQPETTPTETTQLQSIETVNRYTVADLKANPNKIYVFGDNNQRRGKGGQAIIRDEPNAFGIITKEEPNNTEAAFMDDEFLNSNPFGKSNKERIDEDIAKIKTDGRPVVFPKDGIGTGLAKLRQKAPLTFAYLNQRLQEEFGFNNETGETTQPQTGVEISSNAKGLAAALTNPTELAKSKGNITQSYPIEYNGKTYKDVETAYQALKDKSEARTKPTKENSKNYKLMVDLIKAKLQQHPELVTEITKQGGASWISSSTHQPTKQNTVWETGGQNWFIESLADAYNAVTQPQAVTEKMRKVAINQQTLDKINANFASFGMPPVSMEWFNSREPEEQQMIIKCYGK